MSEREASDLVYDRGAVERMLASDIFRVFGQHGFTEAELHHLAVTDMLTGGDSSVELYELLPRTSTQREPELTAEFMRTPSPELDGLTPFDAIGDQRNYGSLRRAAADALPA